MTNDAKLGMLAGVIGVVFAAVFLAKPPSPAELQVHAQPASVPAAPLVPASASAAGEGAPSGSPPETRSAARPSEPVATPVVRVRRDVPAVSVSRQPAFEEEP